MRTLFRSSALAVLLVLPMLLSAQTPRTVLLEQFTGTWCQYCPYGAMEVDSVLNIFPNAVALAYHDRDSMATTETMALESHLLVQSWPGGAVDRRLWNTPSGAGISISRSYWRSAVYNSSQVYSNTALSVTGTYHQDTRLINATVTITPSSDTAGEFYMNVVLSENGLNYVQKWNINNVVYLAYPYYHKRVVRDMLTGFGGDQLTTSGFTANQAVTYPITYTVPNGWNVNNMDLTVFITQKTSVIVSGNTQYKSMNIDQAWQKPLLQALTTIPVELVSFHGAQSGDNIVLQWRTARESNNRGWYVQRRQPGGEWNEVGFVDGYGTTNAQQSYDFTDRQVLMDQTYDYRLRQVDFDGTEDFSPVARVFTQATPLTTRMLPNYPNPFNPSTRITVELAQQGPMTVEIYDMLGRLIRTLADGVHTSGTHVFEWNGTDASGNPVQSGIYFARMTTADYSQTMQMQMTK